MEAVGRAMSRNEQIDKPNSEVAGEKPKGKPLEAEIVRNREHLQPKVDGLHESVQGEEQELTSDFYSVNESRLGYKGRLSLAIRKALSGLEFEASRQTGLSVERLRAEFESVRKGRAAQFEELRVRPEYVISDYRVFLILFISVIRRRRVG